jgi:tetratricopeptide (TPR) repeat protein
MRLLENLRSKILTIFLAGLMLFVLIGGVFFFVYMFSGNSPRINKKDESFSRLLQNYDISALAAVSEKDFENLNKSLDSIEKKALTVESWLSVLKRRRALARVFPPSINSYRQSIERAITAYPWSQPITAIAAAALIKDRAINKETEEKLRSWLPLFNDPVFNTLRVSLHVLLGDFKNPQRGIELPRSLYSDGTEIIIQNLALVKIINQDYGAAADIQTVLNFSAFPSDNFIRFAAEYYYDFGSLERSAELFSRIDDDAALVRQGDALYLAGFEDSARSIWSLLADTQNEISLYNLAVTSENQEKAFPFLEKLVNIPVSVPLNNRQEGMSLREAALIRYSRLLPHSQAIAVLENTDMLKPVDFPFIDLEIQKRRAAYQESRRQLAEAWMLLDRHPQNEDLYQWITWFIFHQHHFDEAEILFRRESQQQSTWAWMPVYRAAILMLDGDIETAEDILRKIPAENADWSVYANIGRILEVKRSPSHALEYYELAVIKAQEP